MSVQSPISEPSQSAINKSAWTKSLVFFFLILYKIICCIKMKFRFATHMVLKISAENHWGWVEPPIFSKRGDANAGCASFTCCSSLNFTKEKKKRKKGRRLHCALKVILKQDNIKWSLGWAMSLVKMDQSWRCQTLPLWAKLLFLLHG